jgi:RNA polymerase sigma-70 factor (ECF subfamily)
MVLAMCRGLLLDPADAEDATQQTFLYAYRSILGGSEPQRPAAWLATIARNECLNRIRARTREPLAESPSGRGSPDALAATIAREDLQALGRTIGELPAQQRRALLLHELHGLPYREVAAAIGVSESAIASLLFRARIRLRAALRRTYAALPIPTLWNAVDHLLARGPVTNVAPVVAKVGTAAVALGLTTGTAIVVEQNVRSHNRPPRAPPARRSTPPANAPAPRTPVPRIAVAADTSPASRTAAAVPPRAPTERHTVSGATTPREARPAHTAAESHGSRAPATPISVPKAHSNSPSRAHGKSSQAPGHVRHGPPTSESLENRHGHGKTLGKTRPPRIHAKKPATTKLEPRKHASSHGSASGHPAVSAHGNGTSANSTPNDNAVAASEPQQHGNGAHRTASGDQGNGQGPKGH